MFAGFGTAEETNKMFDVANEASDKISVLITEISTASGEQAKGIDTINSSITQIETVTQDKSGDKPGT